MAQVVQYNYVVHRILSSGKAVLMWLLKQLTEFSTIILMVFIFLVGSQVYNLRQRNSLKYKIVQLYSENFTIHLIFRKKTHLLYFSTEVTL